MRTERGFTLLEVLIAFAIASLALVLLFRAASGGLLSVRTAGRYDEAVARARSHMAAIGHDAALIAGSSEGADGSGFRWHLDVTPIATGQSTGNGPSRITGPPPPVLYAVAVAISWREGGKDREVVLRTQRMGLGGDDGR
ncbi:MAG TPA: type II secretion system protein [Aliidongia sp.]|uniref:PulJ/GspJ family protein n=1 Tax=Aliidongia sp. TaxID=1914230 RepID=UPI002DDD56C3|nr:type II secretion system protein [Aliidongia sp.]HEV2673546.1 type II secretion system protein [Aliidongia sp.]